MSESEIDVNDPLKHEAVPVLAHQLRTSLSAMKWILKMFLDGDVGTLTPEQHGFIDKAYSANERMIALVSEMLALSKVGGSGMKLNKEEANIIKLMDDALFDFTSESFKKGIEVIFLKPTEHMKKLSIDTGKIRFVVQSLIENAIKYSDKGDRIVIAVEEKGDTVELSFKDTGIGIPANEQPKIFEKFFRAQNACEKEEIGTGLGLFTAKNIVEKHGGKMRFESKENEGTTFYFTLPTV